MTPGWADKLGRELAGDSDDWQRCRAGARRPMLMEPRSAQMASIMRGAARGTAKNARVKIEKVMGKVDDDGEE